MASRIVFVLTHFFLHPHRVNSYNHISRTLKHIIHHQCCILPGDNQGRSNPRVSNDAWHHLLNQCKVDHFLQLHFSPYLQLDGLSCCATQSGLQGSKGLTVHMLGYAWICLHMLTYAYTLEQPNKKNRMIGDAEGRWWKVLRTQVVQGEQPGQECSQMRQQSILLHARLQIHC